MELKQTEICQRSISTMEQQKISASIVLKGIVEPPAPTSSTLSCLKSLLAFYDKIEMHYPFMNLYSEYFFQLLNHKAERVSKQRLLRLENK